MANGTVKWFNNQKGYGFINSESNGASGDIFAHFSQIVMEGYRTLKAGQEVEFEVEHGDKGLHAMKIVPAESETNNNEQESRTKEG